MKALSDKTEGLSCFEGSKSVVFHLRRPEKKRFVRYGKICIIVLSLSFASLFLLDKTTDPGVEMLPGVKIIGV
jgi:hypothetical protein